MPTETEIKTAVAWSAIAEPGDTWAGKLRQDLGVDEALRWVRRPYVAPTNLTGPRGEQHSEAERGWRAAHNRWNLFISEKATVDESLADLEALNGRIIVPSDPDWPTRLNDLNLSAPPALWVVGEGTLPDSEQPAVSIVGARAATKYGMSVAEELARELTESGTQIISGGAYGIDAAAHRGALAGILSHSTTRDLPGTVAIMCGGLTNLYPPGNQSLFNNIIAEGGLIVAEVPPSFRPARWRFLERNRLIAALSDITLVIEAGIRSGAVACANRAVDLDRIVAAVPGPITSPVSHGPHMLIRAGAELIQHAEDVQHLLQTVGKGSVSTD